jgi:hypothetical protein
MVNDRFCQPQSGNTVSGKALAFISDLFRSDIRGSTRLSAVKIRSDVSMALPVVTNSDKNLSVTFNMALWCVPRKFI